MEFRIEIHSQRRVYKRTPKKRKITDSVIAVKYFKSTEIISYLIDGSLKDGEIRYKKRVAYLLNSINYVAASVKNRGIYFDTIYAVFPSKMNDDKIEE